VAAHFLKETAEGQPERPWALVPGRLRDVPGRGAEQRQPRAWAEGAEGTGRMCLVRAKEARWREGQAQERVRGPEPEGAAGEAEGSPAWPAMTSPRRAEDREAPQRRPSEADLPWAWAA
jgi:hypothetical protein